MGQASGELPDVGSVGSLGGSLAISFLSLGLVCVLAYLSLRWLSRRGVGQGATGPIRVRARCALEPRRSVFIVEAAGRSFLIGVSEGAMTLLAEVDPAAVGAAEAAQGPGAGARFAEVLAKVLRRPATADKPGELGLKD